MITQTFYLFNKASWVISQPNYRLGGIVGYQQTRYSWTALNNCSE
ncbi:omptin family outer membrane protease [Symbiopectobacterium sp. Eva_TO]